MDISSVVKKNYISYETVEASPGGDSNREWQKILQNSKGFPEKQEEDAKPKLEEQDKLIAALKKELLEERALKDQLMKILEMKCMEIASLKSKPKP